jgi:hypothetical protein
MVVEMPDRQRNVGIARLADRLAVVEAFQNGKEPLALLQMAGDGVEITAALEARKLRPAGKGFRRSGDGGVDFGLPGRRNAGERFAVGRILDPDAGSVRAGETAVDKMAEDASMVFAASGAGPYSMVSMMSLMFICPDLSSVRGDRRWRSGR